MSSSEWKEYVFSEFVAINSPIRLDSSKEHSFVEMKDLNENRKYAVPSARRPLSGGARFQDGDTLFARITPCLENGKICQVRELESGCGFGSTEFLVFRGREGISHSEFVYYLSRTDAVRRFAEQNMHGTSGRQRVAREAFDNLVLLLPPIETQQRIASILSALDEKIELNRQMNRTLETIAQALFKEWFVDFRYPGATGELQESPLGIIPKNWSVGMLAEYFNFLEGPGLRNWQYTSEGVRFINIRLINGNDISLAGAGFLSELEVQTKYQHFLLKPKDMVVSTSGTLGRTAIVREAHLPLLLNTSVIRFRPIDGVSYPFMYQFLQSEYFNSELTAHASGSVQLNFGPSHLKRIRMIIPPKELVEQYSMCVQGIYSKVGVALDEIQSLSAIRDELLPKLLSGQIEVPLVEDYLDRQATNK